MKASEKLTKQWFNLYGKPSERLILIGLCKKYECSFEANQQSGSVVITGTAVNVNTVHQAFNATLAVAYKRLAFAQASSRLAHVPNKTLVSEFMQAFAAMSYSLTTGEPFMFKATTESQRAGLTAGDSSAR